MFENIKGDISRLAEIGGSPRSVIRGVFSLGFQALFVYRMFHWLSKKKIPSQPIRFFVERFIEITTGISIPAECSIGRGMLIHHFGNIIFHPSVKIGENCTLYHGVTIGDNGGNGEAASIGDDVLIGAGAKLIGKINIGDGCKIGANAVVSCDLLQGSIFIANGHVLNGE